MHTFRQAERTRDRQDLARDVCPFWVKNAKSALVVGRFRFRPSRLGHFQNRLYWRALRGVSLLGTPTREARIVVKKKKKTDFLGFVQTFADFFAKFQQKSTQC